MWSKLNNKLNQLFNNSSKENQENSAKDIIQTTIEELEKAIQKTESLYQNTLENQKEVQTKLQNYQQKANTLYQEALNATKKGQEDLAQIKLSQKNNVDPQVNQYKAIHQTVVKTLLQLEKQIEKLKLKLTETQSKRAILSVKLENAQTQKDLSYYLSELDESGEFENYEEEITKIEVENTLLSNISALEDEFETLEENENIDALKSVIAEEERKLQEQKLAQQFKKVNQVFASQSSKEKEVKNQKKQALKAKKQALLNQLMNTGTQSTTEKISQSQNMMEDFFNNNSITEKSIPEKSAKTAQTNNTEDIFEQFMQDKPSKKTENQKKIEDFFKD